MFTALSERGRPTDHGCDRQWLTFKQSGEKRSRDVSPWQRRPSGSPVHATTVPFTLSTSPSRMGLSTSAESATSMRYRLLSSAAPT